MKLSQTYSFAVILLFFGIGLLTCTPGDSSNREGSIKYQQYYVQGQELYTTYCANCHQSDGSGLGRVYPPLNKSDYMVENFEQVVCLIKYGKQGEVWVNGVMYNQPMKSNPSLTELEVAEIATYIYNAWSIQKGIVEVGEVTDLLTTCAEK